jgi:hypothetical protein
MLPIPFHKVVNGDPDANAFITAAGITDVTQKGAINTLVVDLKAYGLWSKMIALYPMVGGTASTHKYNLKDPRDLDAAYRISWNGTITHSSTGALGNGSTGYGDTHLNPYQAFTTPYSDYHISYYSRTDSNAAQVEFGARAGGTYYDMFLELRVSGTTYFGSNGGTSPVLSWTDGDSLGFYHGKRNPNREVFKNGTSKASDSQSPQNLANCNIYILALSLDSVASYHSIRECAFASIGSGMDSTDATNLYNVVQAFQTTLGRQV